MGVVGGAVGGVLAALALAALGTGALVSTVAFAGLCGSGAGLGAVVGLLRRASALRSLSRHRAVVPALHEAMRVVEPEIGDLRGGEDGWWIDAEAGASPRFVRALAELVGPVRAPRYLLGEGDGTSWPVPEELGARRDLAEQLVRAWCAHVGPAVTIYTRNPEGRERLVALWRAGASAATTVRIVETWE